MFVVKLEQIPSPCKILHEISKLLKFFNGFWNFYWENLPLLIFSWYAAVSSHLPLFSSSFLRLTSKETVETSSKSFIDSSFNVTSFLNHLVPKESSFQRKNFQSRKCRNTKLQKLFSPFTFGDWQSTQKKMKTINISKVMFVQFRIDWEILSFSSLNAVRFSSSFLSIFHQSHQYETWHQKKCLRQN